MKKTNFALSRVKSIFKNDEEKALKSILEKTGLQKEDLISNHTEKLFVWEKAADLNFQPETETESETPTTFSIAINEVENENEADHKAIEALDTFGANLKTDHNKTHYVYSKIR